MYNNQDILKKHTALTVSRKDVDTSFIMFPVRLETRFVDDYPVEDVSEPDKVLYAFKSLWHYVEALRHGNSEDVLLERATKLVERVEDLDTVYREDKTRLRKLSTLIVEASRPTGELAGKWERIRTHIRRLATLDVISDNEATEFLRKLDFVDRTIRRMVDKPGYDGKLRKAADASYSQTAKYKAARRLLKECLPVLEQLLPADPSKSIVNRFSHITKKQFQKFERVMRFFEVDRASFDRTYCSIGNLPIKTQRLINGILVGLKKDFQKYEVYRYRYLGGGKDQCKPRKQSLHDKMLSKVGRYHHYTLFAEKMILWDLRMAVGKRDIATPIHVRKWRELASSTIFSYHEEREWLLKVLDIYNDFEPYKKKTVPFLSFEQNHLISPSRLNKNNKFIRNRKLRYRKKMKCLLIRVYPDTIAVTQAAKGLSTQEIMHARQFWVKYFHAQSELEREAAWKSLCSLYAPPRAAFIARKQFPNQLEQLKAAKITEATNLNQFFPDLDPVSDTDAESFTVPVTELMPDRFLVQATLDNGKKDPYTIVQYGRLIPKSLQVGLDLNNEPEVSRTEAGLRFDGNIRWMTDYAEAERMGMAITIPLESYKWDHYTKVEIQNAREQNVSLDLCPREFLFQSIYVTGLKEFDTSNEKDSKICSELLQKVFNAHLYGDEGLELLKIGTPTNIIGEEEECIFDTGEGAQMKEFYQKSIIPLENYVQAGRMNGDADRLSYLFGIAKLKPRYKDNPFLNTANRENAGILKQQLVNEAFLDTVKTMLQVKVDGVTKDHPLLDLLSKSPLRDYFVKDVSPVGVFPSFRVGDQPYGIVPVCDFRNLTFQKGNPLYLVRNLLLFLTDKWNALSHSAVISEENMHFTNASRLKTEERYLQAVGGTPYSSTFYMRPSVFDPELLDPNYFTHIIHGEGNKDAKEDPVASLRTIIAQLYPMMTKSELIKQYFPDYYDIFVTDVGPEQVRQEFDWGEIKKKIAKNLRAILKQEEYEYEYEELFPDEKELEMYITGTFDLFNYRLDAWLTGLLKNRLGDRMHYTKTHKIAIGSYGWVFNLKEDRRETVSYEYVVAPSVNQAVTAAVLRSSFNRSAEGSSQDYSLNVNLSSSRVRQALRIIEGVRNGLSVGAVLGSDLERLLHEEYKKSGQEMDYFIYFLRQAYPLNNSPVESLKAANNTDADKGFRDATIDVLNGSSLIEDFRTLEDVKDIQKHLLTQLYEYGNPRNSAGEKHLWEKLTKIFGETDHSKIIGLFEYDKQTRDQQVFKKKVNKLVNLIQQMEDGYDALADVVTSESVYKLTQGNREAVEALMSSLQTGRNIPEPEVTEIPLTSAHIDQRVFVALDPAVDQESLSKDSLMQQAEPSLDLWMGQMLGFDQLTIPVQNKRSVSNLSLSELGVTPSELVYLSGDWNIFYKYLEALTWIPQSYQDSYQQRFPGPRNIILESQAASDSASRLVKGPGKPLDTDGQMVNRGSLGDTGIPLDEAEWAVDSMREMLSRSRELRQSDMIATTEAPDEAFDRTVVLKERYGAVKKLVQKLANSLAASANSASACFAENPDLPADDFAVLHVFNDLLQAFRCGVIDAVSQVDKSLLLEQVDRYEHPTEFAELLRRQKDIFVQASHVAEVLHDRVDKAEAVLKEGKQNPSYADAIRQLLLSSFRVVQPFRIDRNPLIDATLLEKQKDIKWFGNVNETVLENELTGLADVRTQLNALHQLRLYAQWNGIDASVRPMQLDTEEVDHQCWLGTQVPKEEFVHDANVYTVLNADRFAVRDGKGVFQDAAGLVIDYWAERIPYRRQTAAVTFAYDQPDAEPPQAILVGVSTLGGRHRWSEKRMVRTIRSAMYQIQSRLVEPEHLYADKWTSVLFPLLRIKPEIINPGETNQNNR